MSGVGGSQGGSDGKKGKQTRTKASSELKITNL